MYLQKALAIMAVGLAASPLASATSAEKRVACTAAAIPRPKLFGAEILNLTVAEHHNQTVLSIFPGLPTPMTVSYCGVNVYVHMAATSDTLADP